MSKIRADFPDLSITPKLHLLEDHVCSFIRKWHMGLGFYGEQGIEGLHKEFNIRARAFQQVLSKADCLKQLVSNHHIGVSPKLSGNIPQPQKRQKLTK